MKNTVFIILSWLFGIFGGAFFVVSCSDAKYQNSSNEQTEQSVQESDLSVLEKEGKVVASFMANGVWCTEYSAYSPASATVSFAYLLIDNGDVIIIYPSIPKLSLKRASCSAPFTKEEAKIILEAQLNRQPTVKYR